MQILVKVLSGQEISVEVDGSELISSVKRKVESELNVPFEQQRLVFKGSTLANSSSLNDYKIPDSGKLHLFVKKTAVKSSPETETLWTELKTFLNGHFSEPDAEVVLKHFIEDFKNTLKEMSLDDLERMGQYHLETNSASNS